MSANRTATKLVISLFLTLGLLISGCGPGQIFGPTVTPMPTATSTPLPGPKIGHWEGEPSVSFDVTKDGKIRNFFIIGTFGSNTCEVTIQEITIETDGKFATSDSVVLTNDLRDFIGLGAAVGIPTPVVTQTDSGETIVSKLISGKLTVTGDRINGSYEIIICENRIELSSGGSSTWNATWKRP